MEPKLGHDGLTKRPTYNELLNYIEKDPDKIRYPNRSAGQAWDSIFRVDFSNSDAHMAAQLDQYAQTDAPGNIPYIPPSDRPAGPGPPPGDPSVSPPDVPPPTPWSRYLPTPIPLDPSHYINRVNGNGGPGGPGDLAEPLLPQGWGPGGPPDSFVRHPAHDAAAVAEAAAGMEAADAAAAVEAAEAAKAAEVAEARAR